MTRRRKIESILPVLIMIFIFVQSAFPSELSGRESGLIVSFIRLFWEADPEKISFAVRKCAHFTEYLALGLSLLFPVKERFEGRAARGHEGIKPVTAAFFSSWIFGTLYAVTDEIHQIFVEGRSCELRDMLIDSAGVLTGLVIALLILRRKRRKKGAVSPPGKAFDRADRKKYDDTKEVKCKQSSVTGA